MFKNIDNFREKHGDTARVVLFQLAALTADCFLLWPRRHVSAVKTAVSGACALLLHGLAYGAAKYLEKPKPIQAEKNNKDDPSLLVRPATP